LQDKEVPPADGRLDNPRVRYETRDVRFPGILAILIAGSCIGGLDYFVVWKIFRNREAHQAELKVSPFPLAPQPRTNLPQEPRLEQIDRLAGIESSNVFDRQSASIRLLTTYGQTPEQGYIRIPIERAMQLVLKDLPVRKPSPQHGPRKDDGLLYSGDSNSGRILRETPP
jgi:hypothetical protein